MPIRYLPDSEREKFEADRGILYTLCKQSSGLIPEELASPEKSDSVFHSVNIPQSRCRNCDLRFGVEGPFLGEKREALRKGKRSMVIGENLTIPYFL